MDIDGFLAKEPVDLLNFAILQYIDMLHHMVAYRLFYIVCLQETDLKFNIGECEPKEALQTRLMCSI